MSNDASAAGITSTGLPAIGEATHIRTPPSTRSAEAVPIRHVAQRPWHSRAEGVAGGLLWLLADQRTESERARLAHRSKRGATGHRPQGDLLLLSEPAHLHKRRLERHLVARAGSAHAQVPQTSAGRQDSECTNDHQDPVPGTGAYSPTRTQLLRPDERAAGEAFE